MTLKTNTVRGEGDRSKVFQINAFMTGKPFPMSIKVLQLLVLSASVLFLSSCGKKNATPAPSSVQEPNPQATPSSGQSATPATASPASPANSPVQSVAEPAPDLVPLTQAVQIFIFRNRRRPNSVDELVSAGLVDKIPRVPSGKKLIISPTTPQVIMVEQ